VARVFPREVDITMIWRALLRENVSGVC